MKKTILCNFCHIEFDIASNMKYKISSVDDFVTLLDYRTKQPFLDGDEIINKANSVICPYCRKELSVNDYKLFGIVPPQMLKITIIVALIMIIGFVSLIAIRGR